MKNPLLICLIVLVAFCMMLIGLKLAAAGIVAYWSWTWVLAPFWMPAVFWLCALIVTTLWYALQRVWQR
jgi:hypothetical protein